MSGGDYNYYYQQSQMNYSGQAGQQWGNWSMGPQQYAQNYSRSSTPYHGSSLSPISHSSSQSTPRSHNYHSPQSSIARPFHPHLRYNTNQYNGNQQGWPRNQNNYKRSRMDSESEPRTKTIKRKKKPLSQNVPSKKDWTIKDAEKALNVEKEYNKRNKNTLIIKFPDHEVNRDVVLQFNAAIDNVYFQQPSTPRFCFVTLEETADADAVISALNQQKFGDGLLSAEYKRDREEDVTVNAEDIDPLTLYVGNLAQEITKNDMITTYPKSKRIDIGYAKKGKYTRYAFVTFRAIDDSIEAFKNTRNILIHNKSINVRFRRLHGTVGMPGESRPQNPPKSLTDNATTVPSSIDLTSPNTSITEMDRPPSTSSLTRLNDYSLNDTNTVEINANEIKKEPLDNTDEDHKPVVTEFTTPFLSGSLDEIFAQHRPKVKTEVKEEGNSENCSTSNGYDNVENTKPDTSTVKSENSDVSVRIKDEPRYSDVESDNEYFRDDSDSDDGDELTSSATNFGTLYKSMLSHADKISSLKKQAP